MIFFVACGSFISAIAKEDFLSESSVPHKSFSPNPEPEPSSPLFKLLRNKLLLNAALFQLGWFACVLGGDYLALSATVFILFCHARFFMTNHREWWYLAAVALLGLLIDNAMSAVGVFTFAQPSAGLISIWLVCIWVLFAATLKHSMGWLQGRWLLAAALGAVFAPMSYLAGSKLAPVTLATPLSFSLIVLSLCWAVLFPLLLLAARRF